MKKYKRVSYGDRCQIYAMLKRDFSLSEIAVSLGFHKSTISREISRNKSSDHKSAYRGYYPADANSAAAKESQKRVKKTVIVGEIQGLVVEKLKLGWSPEKICGRLSLESKEIIQLSHVTV